jgi:hypothetical protein
MNRSYGHPYSGSTSGAATEEAGSFASRAVEMAVAILRANSAQHSARARIRALISLNQQRTNLFLARFSRRVAYLRLR